VIRVQYSHFLDKAFVFLVNSGFSNLILANLFVLNVPQAFFSRT
jgi:hypothetical protein